MAGTTTTKKTTTKKTTATKTTAKKATTTKATAKKVTAKKTTTTKATELSVSGNKKISTLKKEFTKKFPYLQLGIFYSYAREQVKKGEGIYQIDINKTLASVRRANSSGDISISGNKKVKSLEKEFDTVFGLYAQVCFTTSTGGHAYTIGSYDEMTLSQLNEYCEKTGCLKNIWK